MFRYIIQLIISQTKMGQITCMSELALVISKVKVAIVIRKVKRNTRQTRSWWYSLKNTSLAINKRGPNRHATEALDRPCS